MRVGVDEAGEDGAAFGVDDLFGGDAGLDLGAGADGGDAAVVDEHRAVGDDA